LSLLPLLSLLGYYPSWLIHSLHSIGIERFHQPTRTGVCNSLLTSLNTPTTNNRHPRPIARRPGLPSADPSDTPTIVIAAPPIVKILFITDILNTPSPFALVDGGADDDVHLSVQVLVGRMSDPSYQEF